MRVAKITSNFCVTLCKLDKLTPLNSFDKLTFFSVLGLVRFWCWYLGRQEKGLKTPAIDISLQVRKYVAQPKSELTSYIIVILVDKNVQNNNRYQTTDENYIKCIAHSYIGDNMLPFTFLSAVFLSGVDEHGSPGFDLGFHFQLASSASEVVTQLALPAIYWPDFFSLQKHTQKMHNIY